jgi:mono/diheme cytochrome c family protein
MNIERSRPRPTLGIGPIKIVTLGLLWAVAWLSFAASAQDDIQGFDVLQGQKLAVLICANCHVVPNQRGVPILRPPASSFEKLAQRSYITSDWIRNFLRTTHRDELSPSAMPDPMLIDQHINQITAYLMSLKAAR